MTAKRTWKLIVPILAIFTLSLAVSAWAGGFSGGVEDALGPHYNAAPQSRAPWRHPPWHGVGSTSWVRHWNEIAINASGLDHTPVMPGENRVFGEQYGPTRAS